MLGRWNSFGWDAREVDGHDCAALREALVNDKSNYSMPRVIVAELFSAKVSVSWRTRSSGITFRFDEQYRLP